MLSESVIIFEIFDVQFWLPWTRTVQGNPRLMVMMPIGSQLVVSYMTSTVFNVVSLTAFEAFNVKALDLGRFKVIQGQRWWCQSTAHEWLPIWLLLTPTLYLSPLLKYLTCNFDDPEIRQFKVIHGQRSWCQSIAHWWFPIRLLLTATSYLSPS